jgi:hypothetical protein
MVRPQALWHNTLLLHFPRLTIIHFHAELETELFLAHEAMTQLEKERDKVCTVVTKLAEEMECKFAQN